MPKLKVLAAKDVRVILEHFGFTVVSQRGSHMKFRRTSRAGERETLVLPDHKELDRGTLRAIYRQASRYIPEDELFDHFFSA
jgi:predicted RNA binding protein YcfA (HicA-like mRNA interferase family)